MAMTKEEMRLQEIEDVLYEIKDAVAAIEFNWLIKKPFDKYVARLDKARVRAKELQIKTERTSFYVDLGRQEAKECLEELKERGYL